VAPDEPQRMTRISPALIRPVAAAGCALLACLVLTLASSASAAGRSVSKPTAQRLVIAIQHELHRQALPGAIVGVRRDGRAPWIVARGVSNLQTQRRMRTDEHVRIGSVTKSFVTTLLLRLAQEGRLSLDDPIGRYVAGVPNGDEITLRQLANMTSGLADLFANEQFTIDYFTGETFTPTRLVELGIALPPVFAPGTGWSYSNTNTVLLGLVIERVTGKPLATALQRRIFRRLRMHSSSLPSEPKLPKPFPYGYTHQTINQRLGDATFNTPTATWAAGGMVSTVRDLLRAAPMFGTGRPLLSSATQRAREQWVGFPPNSRIQQYGLGVFRFNGWIGHNGGIPGYTAIDWYLPRKRLSLVVSVNSDIHVGPRRADYAYEPASDIAHDLTGILSPRHVAPSAVKVRGSQVTIVD
jgi:D-alanyl-D-alanine carboxypeptidase